jgi:hypothetical protein
MIRYTDSVIRYNSTAIASYAWDIVAVASSKGEDVGTSAQLAAKSGARYGIKVG